MDGERSPDDSNDDSTAEPNEPSPSSEREQLPEEAEPAESEDESSDEVPTADDNHPDADAPEEAEDADDQVADDPGDEEEAQTTEDDSDTEDDDQAETEATDDAVDEDASEADEDDTEEYAPTSIDEDYEVEVPPYAQVSGPSEDQEMPLAEHIEEMLKRLAVIIAIAGIVSLVTFPIAEELINFLWNSILPEGDLTRPRLYGILELKLTELKVASLAGLIVALPVLVHQTYQFMRPGLYPHERRYYLAAIPTSLVLALVGVSFAYFIVLPAIFTYFLYYSQDVATIGFALGRTFDLILILMGYLAIVFQIPLFIMLAMMMGLVTRQWLADRRILFWGGFLGISFIFSPDPTGMAPIVVALTMVVLFEGTLLLTKWTQGRSSSADA